jgi:hypothetical protein
VSDAEGPYLNSLSQRKPLSVSDICPAKLVTWQPVIPNGSIAIPCMAPGKIATPQRCVPERSLGAQIGLGRGRQNERDIAMVEDPPIDLEEVVVGTGVPRVDPKTRRELSRRFFQFKAAETLREDNQAAHTRESRQPVSQPPVD